MNCKHSTLRCVSLVWTGRGSQDEGMNERSFSALDQVFKCDGGEKNLFKSLVKLWCICCCRPGLQINYSVVKLH